MLRIGFTAIALIVAASASASAAPISSSYEGGFVQEQQLASAILTPHERRVIRRNENRIYAMERRARADRVVTRAERRQINQAQRELNSYIRRARAS